MARLSIVTNGRGTVSPALGGQDLVVGKGYKVTPFRFSDEILIGWTRGVTSERASGDIHHGFESRPGSQLHQ